MRLSPVAWYLTLGCIVQGSSGPECESPVEEVMGYRFWIG